MQQCLFQNETGHRHTVIGLIWLNIALVYVNNFINVKYRIRFFKRIFFWFVVSLNDTSSESYPFYKGKPIQLEVTPGYNPRPVQLDSTLRILLHVLVGVTELGDKDVEENDDAGEEEDEHQDAAESPVNVRTQDIYTNL